MGFLAVKFTQVVFLCLFDDCEDPGNRLSYRVAARTTKWKHKNNMVKPLLVFKCDFKHVDNHVILTRKINFKKLKCK